MEEELKHYGTKGMKWGVRRKIRSNAIKAARLKSLNTSLNKSIIRSKKTIDKHKQDLKKNSDKVISKKREKIEKHKQSIKIVNNYRTSLVKSLSESDIRQGEKYVSAIDKAKFATLAVPIPGSTLAALPIIVGVSSRNIAVGLEAKRYEENRR